MNPCQGCDGVLKTDNQVEPEAQLCSSCIVVEVHYSK